MSEPRTEAGKVYANGSQRDMIQRYGHGYTLSEVVAAIEQEAAALVRTPETLDGADIQRLRDAIYERVGGWEPVLMLVSELEEAVRRAAPSSPTPPEGLRTAAQRFLDADDTFDRRSESTSDQREVAAFQRERAREALVVALRASPAPDPEGLHDEFAWLIERGQPEKQVPTVWWADRKRWGLAHMDEWTEDANKAYRFATKAEAEDYIERHSPIPSHRPRLGRAVEHGFLASPAPDPGACRHDAGWHEDEHEMTRCDRCGRWRDEIMFEGGYRGEGQWPAPDPGAGLRAAAQDVVGAWDAMILASLGYGEQGPLYPNDTVALADAIAPLRAALAPSAEPPETT